MTRPSPGPTDKTVVFQMIVSRDTVITLEDDGRLTYEFLDHVLGTVDSSETISRQIPIERVDSLRALLKEQNFSNLNQMGYGNKIVE